MTEIEKLTQERDEARRIADDAHRRAEILAVEDRRHLLILTDVHEALGPNADGTWPEWRDLGPGVRALRRRAEEAEAALEQIRLGLPGKLAEVEDAINDLDAETIEWRTRALAAEARETSLRADVLGQLEAIEADAREGHEMLVEAMEWMRRAAAAELRAVAS